ncbi:MAG: hypothetical protein LUE89_00115 [Clostridiales bacterium]|nr:hypothetical protein [Clostridiales bacterium]
MEPEKKIPPVDPSDDVPPDDTPPESSIVILDDQPRMIRFLVKLPQGVVALILSVALLLSFGVGCGVSSYRVGSRLTEARSAGYEEGEAAGYEVGYDEGESAGYSTGYDVGALVSYDTGYEEGQSAGYDSGYEEGYNAGTSDGYATGYEEGQTAGYTSGYEEGYSAGKTAAASSSTSSSGSSGSSSSSNTYTYSSSVADSTTVYVSYSGNKIHLRSNCSGMKNYKTMTYTEAKASGADECKNCFR